MMMYGKLRFFLNYPDYECYGKAYEKSFLSENKCTLSPQRRMNETFFNHFNKDIDIIAKALGGFEEKINTEHNAFKKEYL